jgi:hypothetical protein
MRFCHPHPWEGASKTPSGRDSSLLAERVIAILPVPGMKANEEVITATGGSPGIGGLIFKQF